MTTELHRAIVVPIDGPGTIVMGYAPARLLESLRTIIKCDLVEAVTVLGGPVAKHSDHGSLTLWVDEDGIANGKPLNQRWLESRELFGLSETGLFGRIVITGGVDDEGETRGLSPNEVDMLLEAICPRQYEMWSMLNAAADELIYFGEINLDGRPSGD